MTRTNTENQKLACCWNHTVLAIPSRLTNPQKIRVIPCKSVANGFSRIIGAATAEFLSRRRPALGDLTVFPVASGLIAGESLMGIVIALLIVAGVLSR